MTQICALIAKHLKLHCTSSQNVLTLLSSVRLYWTRLSNISYQILKVCLLIDNLRYLLKAMIQTTLNWKELTQKSKHLHKHSYFKQSVFWISQQHPFHLPPSLDSPSFNLQFHNSQFTNYLFSHSSFFPLFITPLSFSFLSISSGGCDVRVVDGIPLLWALLPNSHRIVFICSLFYVQLENLQFKIKWGNSSCEVHMDL